MEVTEIINQVYSGFQKDRHELEAAIQEMEMNLQNKSKKKSFKNLCKNKDIENTIKTLKMELTFKADEIEEFQFRVADILSKKPFDAAKLINTESKLLSKHLHVYRFRRQIMESIKNYDVTILVADTGSGKSTLLTQFLHSEDEESVIFCCQPRKIAASSLVDYTNTFLELDPKDSIVAYDFNEWETNYIPGKSKIVYTTNSGFLHRWRTDHHLKDIDVVVMDETHERTLTTDLLLGIMNQIHQSGNKRSKPIKTVVMSATIDPSIFYNFFADSGIRVNCISIPGKTFPVQCIYDEVPLSSEPRDYVKRMVDTILTILKDNKEGDILGFLATPLEIEEAYDILNDNMNTVDRTIKVYTLHGGVEPSERKKLFSKNGFENEQRIILSTNIAETSLTLPGIVFVVDSGRQKEFTFDLVRNVGTLTLAPISKSSAIQRTGRAGRVCPGICYRLYRKEDYDAFPSASLPELLSLPLDQALLSLFHLGFKSPKSFNFIEPPPPEALEKGISTLSSLHAIQVSKEDPDVYTLTDIGEKMNKLPLIPKLSHFIINTLNCRRDLILEVLIICGVLSSRDSIFYRSNDYFNAKIKKLKFCDERSDFLTMINAFKMWNEIPKKIQNVWCRDNMISNRTMKDVSKFILATAKRISLCFRVKLNIGSSIKLRQDDDHYECILKQAYSSFKISTSIFSGHPKSGYINGANGETMVLHPSSSINCVETSPWTYLCYDKVLTTSRTFILNAFMVKSAWLDEKEVMLSEKVKNKIVNKYESNSRLGQDTIRKFVFPNLKTLIKTFKDSIDNDSSAITNFLEIDINLNLGTLVYWCHSKYQELATNMIEKFIDEARKKAMDLKVEISLPEINCVANIGFGGFLRDFKHVSSNIGLLIEGNGLTSSIARDIQGQLNSDGIVYVWKKTRNGCELTFDTLKDSLHAKKTIDENFPELKNMWSNDKTSWLIFNYRGSYKTPSIHLQTILDNFEGAIATVLPVKKVGRTDIKVSTPSRKITQRIFKSLTYNSYCTLFLKKTFTFPSRATMRLKSMLAHENNVRVFETDDVTIVSWLTTSYSRHFFSRESGQNFFLETIVMIENMSPFLNMENHLSRLDQIESLKNVIITQTKLHGCLAFKIHGLCEWNINDAKYFVKKYFDELTKTTLVIPFDETQGHRGVLPKLFKKYGSNLMKLLHRTGVNGVEIHRESRNIEIVGNEEVIGEIGEEIQNFIALQCDVEANSFDPCVYCGDSADQKNSVYRLQLCGHKVCYVGCIQTICASPDFPLKCPMKECDKELSSIDIKTAISMGESLQDVFLRNCFKNLSPNFLKCPSYCSFILKITPNKETSLEDCPICECKYCLECKLLAQECACTRY